MTSSLCVWGPRGEVIDARSSRLALEGAECKAKSLEAAGMV